VELIDDKFGQLNTPPQAADERALTCCRLAAGLIHTGQYEAARGALGHFWQGIGTRPELSGLAILTTAEVLLQCGVLSGWLGSARQTPDAQEQAKDLLSEALRLFESEGEQAKISEVQYELGMCYFRLGAYDAARVVLEEAARGSAETQDTELRAKTLIRRTLVEISLGRYHDAHEILGKAQSLFENCSDALKGRWHGQMALVLRRLATAEGRADYADRAIMEFTAAIYHYEQAGHERYCGINLNNLAMLLYKLRRYSEAHEYLDRAREIYERLKDPGNLAQVNETRARVLVAEGRYKEANRVISGVVRVLEKGGERALLADALSIQGVVWSRLANYDDSLRILRTAINVAQNSGALSNAGLAALTLIEEHGATRLSENELHEVYRRADELLKNTQDAEEIARLRACARIVAVKLAGANLNDEGFSLSQAVREYEARFIEQALEIEQGSVSRAAKRLGIKHQILAYLLSTRHRELLNLRTPALPRKRSIIKKFQ
jgi:tetratricopeptide (TPR) repeat protein